MKKIALILITALASISVYAQDNILQSQSAAINFQPTISINNLGEPVYDINWLTTYDEIRYSFGTPVRMQGIKPSMVVDTYLISEIKDNKDANYLEVTLENNQLISCRLVNRDEINPAAKTLKRFSTGKYAKINKLSIFNISLGDDFEESRIKLLSHPDFEFTQTNSNNVSLNIIAGKKIILISDAYAKVAQIELFANKEDIR